MSNRRVWSQVLVMALALGISMLYLRGAWSHDMPGVSPELNAWYQQAETNMEARKTFPSPWAKCCNHAEVIDVKDIIFPTQEHGWQWNDKGVVKNIPNVIIHWHESAPNNQPTLFVYLDTMTCFYPPQGGV